MTRRLLVDGMNVIGSRPDGWWRDRTGAMRALVELLDRYAEQAGAEVRVVFDGRPRELGPARTRVDFAQRRGSNAADDEIAALVEADPDPGSLAVVTSDQRLAERVRGRGAEAIGAGAFRRALDEL